MSHNFSGRAAKVDGNQVQIVRELRELGFDVDIISQLKRKYDLVVSGFHYEYRRTVGLRVEVKMPKMKLSADEVKYWDVQKNPYNLIIATQTKDVLDWFGWDKNLITLKTERKT
jgi:hypothetical protein